MVPLYAMEALFCFYLSVLACGMCIRQERRGAICMQVSNGWGLVLASVMFFTLAICYDSQIICYNLGFMTAPLVIIVFETGAFIYFGLRDAGR